MIPAKPAADLPRERLERLGPRALSESELLTLVLGHGGPRLPAARLARRLSRGPLQGLGSRQLGEWLSEPGVGRAQAARLVAVFEIARRVNGPRPARDGPIRQPRDVGPYLMTRYGDEREECFGVLLLDARNRLLREHRLSHGGWCASVVRPREVFRQALLAAAPAVILFHNHPSGDPTPSREDLAITSQLREAGELLGIRVLDHLIVGAEGFVSLRERQTF
jgi:DNA repair protein RadC